MNEELSQTVLEDFSGLLEIAQKECKDALLVGGHAVNLWASLYLDHEPALRQFLPFTSKDLDLLGNANTLETLVRRAGVLPVRTEAGAPSPVLGHFPFTLSDGRVATVEVLFSLAGVTVEELTRGAALVAVPQTNLVLRLPSPLACLKAKIHNLAELDQRMRQDEKHVRMLLLCNRAALLDALAACESGRLATRTLVNALEAMLKLGQQPVSQRISGRHAIDWTIAFPISKFLTTPLEPVQRFYDHRLRTTFSACPPRSQS